MFGEVCVFTVTSEWCMNGNKEHGRGFGDCTDLGTSAHRRQGKTCDPYLTEPVETIEITVILSRGL